MPKDDLRPLPDDIVAPLLQALVTVRPTPENRLYLHSAATTDARLAGTQRAITTCSIAVVRSHLALHLWEDRVPQQPMALEHAARRQRAVWWWLGTLHDSRRSNGALPDGVGRIHAKEGFKRERG